MLEIFQYQFMVRAFIAGIAIAAIAPMIGTFLVVRRYSLIADTLAHVSLVGVALALLFSMPVLPVALVIAVLAGVGIERLRATQKLGGDAVLALFLTGSLALAVTLFGLLPGYQGDIASYLFGSITTVSVLDVWIIVAAAVVVALLILFLRKYFFTTTLHETLAAVGGINVSLHNTILMILTAIVVGISMRTVGVLLIGALLIIPVLTAQSLRLGFWSTMAWAILFSLGATIVGLIMSFYATIPSGAGIVLTLIGLYLLIAFGARFYTKQ